MISSAYGAPEADEIHKTRYLANNADRQAQTEEDTKATPINLRTFHDLKVKCYRLETIIEILKPAP